MLRTPSGPQRVPAGPGASTGPQPSTGPQRALAWPSITGPQPSTGPQRVPARPGTTTGPQPLTGPQRVPTRPGATGPQPVPGLRRVTGAGADTGAQQRIGAGTGAQPILGNGTGGQPTLGGPGSPGSAGWTPVQGLPPGHERSETPPDGFWYPSDGAGPPDDVDPSTRVDPRPPRTTAGGRRSAKAKPKRRLLSRSALLAAVAVVVLAAAFGGYKFFYEPRVNAPVSPSLRLPTTTPGSPDFDQSLGKWQHIGSRTEDPAPLTVAGLFPPQFLLNGTSYVRTAASVTKNCSQAVYGAQLQAALQSGKCSQVARASYVSGNGQLMGTVGVVNLDTSAAAQKAGQATGPQEVIAPLPAKTGATKKLGDGTGVVQAEVKGHYLILMWAQLANLKSPSTPAAKQLLEQFAANLVTGSANINLSTRMLGGKA